MKIFKKDILIILLLILISLGIYLFNSKFSEKGNEAEVMVDGKLFGRYPLYENGKYEIYNGDSYNILVIENGTAKISEASCKNQICVNHKAISKNNESIICIPNKIVVKIISENDDNIDDVAR